MCNTPPLFDRRTVGAHTWVWSALAQLRHAALLIVLVTWGLRLMSLACLHHCSVACMQRSRAGVVAAIGYAWVHCAQSNKWLSWLVENFAVYVAPDLDHGAGCGFAPTGALHP